MQHATTHQFDYIFTGGGCAGLSLLMHGLEAGVFQAKKILVVDKDPKQTNDRTWCFWESVPGLFEPIVKKSWRHLWFQADGFLKKLDTQPYTYKLIRGLDFYNWCRARLSAESNITFLSATVEKLFSDPGEKTGIVADGQTIYGDFIFNSILFQKPLLTPKEYWLLQHFKGWFIETETAAFDAAVGTLMDFRTSQQHGATFFYVLPFSPTQALVEYTLFSKNLLPDATYEQALENYMLQTLHIKNYVVKEKEFGVIPMSNFRFPTRQHHILHIGTAGGQTKASSGYTFRFIQKQSKAIAAHLRQHGTPFSKPHSARFHFYDSVLLHIMQHNTLPVAQIFTELFKKNDPKQVLKFLDNDTTLAEEVQIMSTLPTWPFLKAALKQYLPFKEAR